MEDSVFLDFYRCPESFANFSVAHSLSGEPGYFRFGPEAICYGRRTKGDPAKHITEKLYDAQQDVALRDGVPQFPFDPSELIENLRFERYASQGNGAPSAERMKSVLKSVYYLMRPFLPVSIRKHLQRIRLRSSADIPFPSWPADLAVESILERLLILLIQSGAVESVPFIWFWPHGLPSCAIMTHDVETEAGRDFCSALMDLDETYGIKSSFQIIPEKRYAVPQSFLDEIRRRGFEINIHDLNHDGRLFDDRDEFLVRAARINQYGKEYGASGFRSAALYRNADWLSVLDFSYDMSVPTTGHLEAQQGGCCTAMPFFISDTLELPVSTTQDYSLFHILSQYSIGIWKYQIAQIMRKHALASFIVHPDYVIETRARETYSALLAHLAMLRSERSIWICLPSEANRWWRARQQMKLVRQGNNWVVDGPESDKARVAYAFMDGERLAYRLTPFPKGECVVPLAKALSSQVLSTSPNGPFAAHFDFVR